MNGKRPLLAVCYVFAVGGLLFNLQPFLLGALAVSHDLSDSQLGLTASTALLSSCILVIAGFYWVPRVSWRTAMGTGMTLSALASAALPMVQDFTGVLLAIGGIGAGMAICFAPALVALGTTPDPAKAFGLGMAAQVLLAGIGIFVLPAQLIPHFGLPGFAVFMVLATLPGILMLHWVPNTKDVRMDGHKVTSRPSSNLLGWLALAGLAIFYVGINGVWAFLERIGDRTGLDGTTIGTALSLAFVLGAIGSLSAGFIVRTLGTARALSTGFFTLLAGIALLQGAPDVFRYAGAAFLLQAAWNFWIPIQLPLLGKADPSGRLLVLVPAAWTFGGATGPATGGLLLEQYGLFALYVQYIICIALAWAVFHGINRYLNSPPLYSETHL